MLDLERMWDLQRILDLQRMWDLEEKKEKILHAQRTGGAWHHFESFSFFQKTWLPLAASGSF